MSAPPVKYFYELKEWPSLQTSSEVKRWLGHFFATLSAVIIEKFLAMKTPLFRYSKQHATGTLPNLLSNTHRESR